MVLSNICTNLATLLCVMIDSLMISRYLKADAMAAYSFVSPLLMVFTAFAVTLSTGAQIICGRTMGCGDKENSNRCYSSTVTLCAGASAILTILLLVFKGRICTLPGAGVPGEAVHELTNDYLTGIAPGLPLFMFTVMMVPFVMMSGRRNLVLATIGSMTVTDIVPDALNVAWLKGGMPGMGLASAAGYAVAFCFCV